MEGKTLGESMRESNSTHIVAGVLTAGLALATLTLGRGDVQEISFQARSPVRVPRSAPALTALHVSPRPMRPACLQEFKTKLLEQGVVTKVEVANRTTAKARLMRCCTQPVKARAHAHRSLSGFRSHWAAPVRLSRCRRDERCRWGTATGSGRRSSARDAEVPVQHREC